MQPKPDKFIPALYGGTIMGVISAVPFLGFINCFCCAGILLGGFLAVMFYKNNFTPDTPAFTAGDCMMVGVLAGVIGAVVDTVLSLAFVALFGPVAVEYLLDFLRNVELELPPGILEQIEDALRESATLASTILSFFGTLVLSIIFGMLGGLIGYSVYKPKQQPTMPPPSAPAL